MNLVLLGPPGSGKGTQAKLLSQHFDITHISSGRLLREEAKGANPKAKEIKYYQEKGELVPFDTVLDVIIKKIEQSPQGFILDGTPRNLAQSEHLDWFFKKNNIDIDHIIYYDLSDEEGQKRILSRAKIENRADDTPETIKNRYQIYHQATQPVIKYYKDQNKLITIDALPDIDTIFKNTNIELQKIQIKRNQA